MITDATGEIPLEAVTGLKVDWEKEFSMGFGDMGEAYVRPNKTNRMNERTKSAVALYPSGGVGAWRVKYLDTWTEGSARRFKLTHSNEETIAMMNKKFVDEKPSDAYRRALDLECESELEGVDDEAELGPDLVQARPLTPLMEEEVEAAQPVHPLPVQPVDDYDPLAGSDDYDPLDHIAHGDDDAGDDEVAAIDAVHAVGELMDDAAALDAAEVVMQRGGSDLNYHIGMVGRKGKSNIKHFIASMRKGSTKATLKAALAATGTRGDRAMDSAIAEIKQIDDKGSWTPVLKADLTREERRAVVRTFMFVIDKFSPQGEILKVKARLVAMGNMQNPEGISMDTSAPTVDITSVMAMAAIAAYEGRFKMTCDVGGAFLHTVWPKEEGRQVVHLDRINTRILCQIRPDYAQFVQDDGTMLLELERALYGLVQSARLWYNRLVAVLAREGYVVNPMDPCVWNKDSDDKQCTVLFHVDDLSCSCRVEQTLKDLEALLVSEFGEEHIKCVYGDEQNYLGMHFSYTKDGRVYIDMIGYLEAVLENAGVTDNESAKTPANSNLFLIKEDAAKLDAERAKMFHSLVQGLSYASQRTRCDIMLAISFLKGRVSCPDEFDWAKLRRVLAYIRATVRERLCLGVIGGRVDIDASIDASHAVYQTGRSQGGLAVSFGLGVIKARSHKLGLTTKSSAESEMVTTSDNAGEVIWMREFLIGQGYKMGPAKVRQDNQAAITLLEKGRSDSKRTKHINTRFFFVHDRLVAGEMVLEWTPTEDMVADFFTKPLQGELFLKMRDKLLGVTVFAP